MSAGVNPSQLGLDHDRLPLVPKVTPAEPYRAEHLGKLMEGATNAIAQKIQVPTAIAAQSILSVAALVTQSYADVELPSGQTRPLSLFFVTIASSGDRKSSADNEATRAVKLNEDIMDKKYAKLELEWTAAKSTWNTERRKIETDRVSDARDRKQSLINLGPEPLPPIQPVLTSSEFTFEGLIENWHRLPAALGIYSAEGGQFTAGHAMSGDGKLRTAGGLSELWDGKTYKRIRAKDGVRIIRGRRLAIHLMVQPDAATAFLTDNTLRDQGLLSRLLVAAPDSLIGSRLFAEESSTSQEHLRHFHDRIDHLLKNSPIKETDPVQGLSPRILKMEDEAKLEWIKYSNWVEAAAGPGQPLHEIKTIAAKSAEQAARIAGVLTLMEDENANFIRHETIVSAIWLAVWYFNESLRMIDVYSINEKLIKATALFDWLSLRAEQEIRFSSILQFGPGPTRVKAEADAALRMLIEHNLIVEVRKRPRTFTLTQEKIPA